MACFRKIRGFGLSGPQELFNKLVAKCRYVNENCIGLLKGRFQSLRGMRMDISVKKYAEMMIYFICCAAILHNLLLENFEDWDTELYDFDETAETAETAEPDTFFESTIDTNDCQDNRDVYAKKFWDELMNNL
ncbi:Aste57867_6347 [Aphanomyces stellatus]|uniref:Aste57867_6347 protein n=1 Tax=Aphanomyces stellatus TaxID=120398 RepID=A0A485KFQ7_9STRA|nr:hypothetical protein As57867_006333 [Aphanomyces stellatus]VFT83344.1 Aste57867_6347 [Aphanomyces stellatus]